MRFLSRTLGVLLALVLVGGIGIGVYIGGKRSVALIQRLDFQVAMAATIGTVALLLAATIISRSIRRAGEQVRDVQLHDSKAEAYRKFIGLWEELLGHGKGPDAKTRLSRQVPEVSRLLVLHGSAAVVRAHATMQELDPSEARSQFGDALLEIRKDLGLESRGLEAEELVQLLLSDGTPSLRPQAPVRTESRTFL
jgi:hypothetical protein